MYSKKRRMRVFKKISSIIGAMLVLAALPLSGRSFEYRDSWGKQGFNLSGSTVQSTTVIHSVKEFSMNEKEVNGEIWTSLSLPGVFIPGDEGYPDLPGSARYIAIPQGSKAEYRIKNYRTERFRDIDVAPAPNIPMDRDNTPLSYSKKPEVYQNNAFYPESPVILSEPFKIRGVDVVELGIRPFQYNPVTKELLVYRDLEVEVVTSGGNAYYGEDRLRNRHWDRILDNTIMNSSVLPDIDYSSRKPSSKGTDYEYIIICPDDPIFISYANQLRDFRTKQGIETGVVTITEIGGNTESAIETYINNAYNNWSVPPAAVLLLADYASEGAGGGIFAPEFPDTYYPMVSDNFYADVDTSDGKALPEIVFGRIVAQNETHLQTMVSKIINYETSPPTSASFYNNPITALGWQTERWFQICSEAIGGFMTKELGKSPVRINEVYEGNPTVDPWSTALNTSQVTGYFGPSGRDYIPSTPQELGSWTGGDANDIAAALNNGAFMLLHRDHGITYGWGEPAFTTTNIDMLTNTDLSFIFSMNCQTGMFDYTSEVFAERFHRYTYNGQNAGALGVIAATENSFSFVNDALAWGTFDYIYPDFMPDYGPSPTNNDEFMPAFAMVSGKYFLDYSSWPSNPTEKEETNYLFHMLGDPYQVVYSEVPQNLTIVTQEVFEGENIFYISADLGANIALVVNGEIIATGTGTGSVTGITIPPQTYQTNIILTVTKQNYFRYETTIEVGVPLTNIGGSYSIDRNSIDYGYITVGENISEKVIISNSHATEYLVGDISTIEGYTAAYSLKEIKNILHYTIPPNQSRTFDISFEPSSTVTYSGNITISSSDPGNSTQYLAVSGTGALPDIDVISLTTASAVPDGSTGDSFQIYNQGLSDLDYSLSFSYVGSLITGGIWAQNDFSTFPGSGWTNSGWVSNSGAARATGSGATCTLTSPVFDTSGAGNPVYLEFTQNYYARTGSWTKVEYYTGSSWIEIYYATASTTAAQHIELPVKSSSCQIRFTAYTTRSQAQTAYWDIDNVIVTAEEVPYSWLSVNSAMSGTVGGSGSDTVSLTYDASGLILGMYEADITIDSNDPDESSKVIRVEFVVEENISTPQAPENISVVTATSTEVDLSWDAVTGAVSYNIYRSVSDPYSGFVKIGTSDTPGFQDTDVSSGNRYFYYITSVNAK